MKFPSFNNKSLKSSSQFCIIFDTGTEPEYYLDVHNLVALPSGAIIPYEYRETYLSSKAISLLAEEKRNNTQKYPINVLLFYAQSSLFIKGSSIDKSKIPTDLQYIPTRFAQLLSKPDKIGNNYHFDLRLGGYPNTHDINVINEILEPLKVNNELPYVKFITLSDKVDAFRKLLSSDEPSSWQNIVNQFWDTKIQFCGDAFWRIEGVFNSKTGRLYTPINNIYKLNFPQNNQITKITYQYNLSEGSSYLLYLTSYEPKTELKSTGEGIIPNPIVNIERKSHTISLIIDENTPFILEGSGKEIPLRQYTREMILIRAQQYDGLKELSGDLTLSTGYAKYEVGKRNRDWPVGPNICLHFTVRKETWRIITAAILGIFGVSIFPLASDIWKVCPYYALLLLPLAALSIAISGLIYTGRFILNK